MGCYIRLVMAAMVLSCGDRGVCLASSSAPSKRLEHHYEAIVARWLSSVGSKVDMQGFSADELSHLIISVTATHPSLLLGIYWEFSGVVARLR